MEAGTKSQALEIVRRKANETFDELEALFAGGSDQSRKEKGITEDSDRRRTPAAGPWSLPSSALDGRFEELSRTPGGTFRWPDGNIDHYTEVVRYRGSGDFAGMILELGHHDNGDITGFSLGTGGGSRRAITYFFAADDDPTIKVSMIRGGGPRGRSGFGPSDPTPPAYADFEVEILRDLKPGKWNVQAVVARDGDTSAMLGHTAIQAKLRGLA